MSGCEESVNARSSGEGQMRQSIAESTVLRVGELMRTPGAEHDKSAEVGGLRNFFFVTRGLARRVPHGKGVGAVAPVLHRGRSRRPVIVLWVTDETKGTQTNPWVDDIAPDSASATYWGDNRTPGADPLDMRGNAALVEELPRHLSGHAVERCEAAPLVVMRRPEKGLAYVVGLAALSGAQRVLQESVDAAPCWNMRFTLDWVDIGADGIDWAWVRARARPDLSSADATGCAPTAWQQWVKQGFPALQK
jgi:hypothetical protein